MPTHSRFAIFARVVLLPLVLIAGTITGLGSYYEASDDTTLAWLFSGRLAAAPVPSLPLYFHGYGHGLAALYTQWPGVAWFGVLLGGSLLLSTVLVFAVLDRLLRPWLSPLAVGLVLLGFFGVAWVEHWLWFSYVRVALLLAGGSLVYAAQRPARRSALAIGLVGLGAAWLMRPSLAVLGFGAVLPALLLLAGSWRRALPLVLLAATGLLLATGMAKRLQTPAEKQTQTRDGYFARILDFDQLRPQPRTPADSLGTAAVDLWLMGDATVVNEALCRRAYRFDAADFWGREVPVRLGPRLVLLGRDYFPLLLALLASAGSMRRSRGPRGWFWLVQLGYVGLLGALMGLFKLPPRMALPLLDFWLLTNLVFVVNEWSSADGLVAGQAPIKAAALFIMGRWPRMGAAVGLLALCLYGAKTLHRRQVLGQERSQHERAWAEIGHHTAGHIQVQAGTNHLLKSFSPFRVYPAGGGQLLLLTGWPSHDESQVQLRHYLTGTPDQTIGLARLAAPAREVQWLLSAKAAQWLNRRFRYRAGTGPVWALRPGVALAADTTLRFYSPQRH